jgi:hypothetical protein
MEIGLSKWIDIKTGDMIECIKRLVVQGEKLDYLFFIDPSKIKLSDNDYTFDAGNVGIVKLKRSTNPLNLSIIPFANFDEAKEYHQKDLGKYTGSLFSTILGEAPISVWAEYFRVV